MDQDASDRFVPKDLPVYSWHNKQEGKDQYARFVKEFISAIKHLRYLLEPGAVQRRLGEHPGPQPQQAALRRDWKEDMRRYEAKLTKIDEHFATALGALESSFIFASSPRHIIDKVINNPPANLPVEEWTYQRKFEACWEALRAEYQPSTAVDLSQLRDQIFALSDDGPGGFDHFRSEFHRLHTEMLATNVPNAIEPRELNGIVRDGIRNPTIWALVCHPIYNQDPNAPWEATFEAISSLLTSFRQKGMDPYGESKPGPMIGHTSVNANMVSANPADVRGAQGKRSRPPDPRNAGGRSQKMRRTSTTTETTRQGKQQWSTSQTTTKSETSSNRSDQKCTRCWNSTSHSFRDCKETKCACGKPLTADQIVCFNYDSHSPSAQFPDKVPRSIAIVLDAYRRGKATNATNSSSSTPPDGKGNSQPSGGKSRGKRGAKAFAATIADELARRGVSGDSLDRSA